jgi:predicted nucleotidyltransferase
MKTIDFLDKNSFEIINCLIDEEMYLRKLAEKTKLAPSSVHKITKKLFTNKIILKNKEKNKTLFKLNYSNIETCEIIKLLFIHNIIFSKGFLELKKLNPLQIKLFGNISKGKVSKNSDIDLAIIFENKPSPIEISKIKIKLSNELNREVQIISFNKTEFSSKNENSETIKKIQNSIELWNIQKN